MLLLLIDFVILLPQGLCRSLSLVVDALAVLAADPADPLVESEEDAGSEEEPDPGHVVAPRESNRLEHHLVGDGRDQDSGAECHDDAERPPAERDPRRERSAQEKGGGGDEAPEERLPHEVLAVGVGGCRF